MESACRGPLCSSGARLPRQTIAMGTIDTDAFQSPETMSGQQAVRPVANTCDDRGTYVPPDCPYAAALLTSMVVSQRLREHGEGDWCQPCPLISDNYWDSCYAFDDLVHTLVARHLQPFAACSLGASPSGGGSGTYDLRRHLLALGTSRYPGRGTVVLRHCGWTDDASIIR